MQLAHINIAQFIKPMAHSDNLEFVNAIQEINDLAEQAEGFVWRLKDGSEEGIFGSSRIIVTISVWEDVKSLKNYVYHSNHVNFFRKRAAWFKKMEKPNYALWWIQNGEYPTALEAKQQLKLLWENGISEKVFDFRV